MLVHPNFKEEFFKEYMRLTTHINFAPFSVSKIRLEKKAQTNLDLTKISFKPNKYEILEELQNDCP